MPVPAQPPVTINLDANHAMGEAMNPLMMGVQQNSQAIVSAMSDHGAGRAGMAAASQSMDGVAQGVHELSRTMHDATQILAAPNELIRDPKTQRAVGSRKVLSLVK